uniref:hypothetical protein n=1 Tax=Ningiella ruwaisensis TaxID=2364274 RepID=UPI0010A01DA1|nr:hypothetical protein [Ningiella ruwaisensis]
MLPLVHVFIATTHGLVKIQQIRARTGDALASFVSIANSARVSKITPQFREFVDPQTSPVASYFSKDSHHMIIDKDIQTGESWQLACCIAQRLSLLSRLAESPVQASDSIIIATGQVDHKGARVAMISHLAQKCLQAQSTILSWQKMGCDIRFFVPNENLRQPLPDIRFSLSGVSSLSEVEAYFVERAWLAESEVYMLGSKAFAEKMAPPRNALALAEISKGISKAISKAPSMRRLLNQNRNKTIAPKSVILKGTDTKGTSRVMPNKRKLAFMTLSVLFLLVLMLVGAWFGQNAPPSTHLDYAIDLAGNCDNTSSLALVNQHQASQPAAIQEFQSLNLDNLCELHVRFENLENIPADVVLVSDSYLALPLEKTDEATWEIPLPEFKEANRRYILLVLPETFDAADIQSLNNYLETLYEQGLTVNIEHLANWSTKQSLSVNFIQQELVKG